MHPKALGLGAILTAWVMQLAALASVFPSDAFVMAVGAAFIATVIAASVISGTVRGSRLVWLVALIFGAYVGARFDAVPARVVVGVILTVLWALIAARWVQPSAR